MDTYLPSSSQSSPNQRRGRNESQPNNDRQLSESYQAYHPRQSSILEPSPSHQSYHTRHNLDPMPSEQHGLLNRFHSTHRPTSSPNTSLNQHETLPKLRTSSTLHFEYHTRYPSPPPTTQSTNPPHFPYHSPPSEQRSLRDHQVPDHRRTTSSPPRHLSPIVNPALHRANRSSSSAGNSPMITLPPLSSVSHRPPTQRGVDQAPNHQHVDNRSSPAMQSMPPSITQLPRGNPEQMLPRRHTLDSGHIPVQQTIPFTGGRQEQKRTLPPPPPIGNPEQPFSPSLRLATHQGPSQPSISRPYPSSPPLPTPRGDNPPTSTISSRPLSPSTSQLPQSPQSLSQPTTTTSDGSSSPVTSTPAEAADMALEPLRLGFENVWAQTVQNVRQAMNKMQRDLTRLTAAERRKNANLMRCLVNNSEKLKGQEWTVEELRKENGSLMEKTLENEQLRRENDQKIMEIDTLNQENSVLRRENDGMRKENQEAQEALTKAAKFICQYKDELAKAKAEAATFRREPDVLSSNDANPQTTAAPSDLHDWEMNRLHAEKERERIFNEAVKQLRALTAMEDSKMPYQGSEKATLAVKTATAKTLTTSDSDHDGHIQSPLSELSTSKRKPPPVGAEVSARSTPPPPTHVPEEEQSKVVSSSKSKAEDVEMNVDDDDDDNVTIVPPMTNIRVMQPTTDESQKFKLEMGPLLDLEAQRQRHRQARRGPTPTSSSPEARSRKGSPMVSSTGMKRNRGEYEDDQLTEDHSVRPGMVQGEQRKEGQTDSAQPLHGLRVAEVEAVHTDAEEGEIGLDWEREQKGVKINNTSQDRPRQKGERTPPSKTGLQMPTTPLFTAPQVHPKSLRRWSHYAHYSDYGVAAVPPSTEPSTSSLSPSPQAQRPTKRHPKLGINHMDLLYKTEKEVMVCRICLSLEQNPDTTTAERRKAKVNTKKFPLNASWAELINHCQTEHAKACEDMEKLSPSQVAEMKQRMPPAASMR